MHPNCTFTHFIPMKRLFACAIALLAGLLTLPAPLSAHDAQTENPTHTLEEMVVSVTRNDMRVKDAPQSVTVISKEKIMASPFERVEDIIRTAPGVYNTRHYGTQTSGVSNPITLRGVGGNRVLVLVDGVPQNDNFNNAIAWVAWGHIPKEAIERIEIVRGPSSAVYGSQGMGGVIHIITKTADSDSDKQHHTILRTEAGTSDTYAGHAFHAHRFGDFGLVAAGGYEESDGFYMTETREDYNVKRHREMGKIFGKLNWEISPHSDLSLSGLIYDHETGKGRTFFYDELRLNQFNLAYSRQSDTGLAIKALAYYNKAEKTAFQDNSKDGFTTLYRQEDSPASTWGADLQSTLPLGQSGTLTLGTAFKKIDWDYDDDYTNSTRNEGARGSQRYISPFASLDTAFLDDRLLVSLGARYDHIRTSDGANWDDAPDAGDPYRNTYDTRDTDNFSPKIGATWHMDTDTSFKICAGKGFRAPSLFELYKVHVRQGGRSYRHANPDLDPEEIWSFDIGMERRFLQGLTAKLTYYQSRAKDYIGTRLIRSYQQNGKTYNEYMLDNISRVDIHGIETELDWRPTETLALFANYTWNVSKIKEDKANPFEQGNYLTNDPKHKFHLGARYQNPAIADISLIYNLYLDKYYNIDETTQATDDFWSVDLRISRKIFGQMSAYLAVENLFDSIDNEAISPGSIYTCGLKFEF